MQLALLRHAIAAHDASSDFARPLTREGADQLERALDHVLGTPWRPGTILHSPYVRTSETARAVHARMPDVGCWSIDELALGSLDAILHVVAQFEDPLLIGHEPTLGNLCARLVGAPAGSMPLERAGFALLDVDRLPTTRPARLVAFVPPVWAGAARRG
jgi:phosphohistidine phosphatase